MNLNVVNHIKYYSFYIGIPRSSPSTWKFQDVKQPAATVFEAIQLDLFRKDKCPVGWKLNLYFVNIYYRRVVEYEIRSKSGQLRFNYKKVKIYSQYEISSLVEKWA